MPYDYFDQRLMPPRAPLGMHVQPVNGRLAPAPRGAPHMMWVRRAALLVATLVLTLRRGPRRLSFLPVMG